MKAQNLSGNSCLPENKLPNFTAWPYTKVLANPVPSLSILVSPLSLSSFTPQSLLSSLQRECGIFFNSCVKHWLFSPWNAPLSLLVSTETHLLGVSVSWLPAVKLILLVFLICCTYLSHCIYPIPLSNYTSLSHSAVTYSKYKNLVFPSPSFK